MNQVCHFANILDSSAEQYDTSYKDLKLVCFITLFNWDLDIFAYLSNRFRKWGPSFTRESGLLVHNKKLKHFYEAESSQLEKTEETFILVQTCQYKESSVSY